jgi:hydrophobe/amphiphile efflux-3 (HAE3) family protein
VLAIVAAITLLAVARIVDLRTGELHITFDPSTNALLPRDDEGRRFYDRTRLVFGSDETILVALVDDDVFTATNLRRLQRMSERFSAIEGVHHVVSLTNALNIRAEGDELIIEPFAEEIPDDVAGIAAIRRHALESPIYAGNLVSRDGGVAAVMIYLMDISENEFLKRGIDREIRRIAEHERGDATIWITGSAYVKAEMSRVLLEDLQKTVPLAACMLMLVSFLAFRHLANALVPLVGVGISVVWLLALFVATGNSLNVITVVLPPLILVVGFAYSVHVVAEYQDLIRRDHHGASGQGRVAEAMGSVALPLAITGLTTAAGFLSLATSRLSAIREFGIYATAGVAITMVVAMTFTPAALQLLPEPRSVRMRSESTAFDRMTLRIADFDVRRRTQILFCAFLVTIVSMVGISQIQISTDVIGLFAPETEIRQHFESINSRLEGSDAVYVVLRAETKGAFKEPENLRTIEELQRWLEDQPEIGGTTSLVDYVRLINEAFHEGDPTQLRIPESRRLVAQLLAFGSNDELKSFVDSQYQTASIVTRSKAFDSRDVTALVTRIEDRLARLPANLEARVTGNSVLISKTADDIARGQAISLSLALGIIFAILCVLFMSVRVGFLALLPNMLPVLVYFGTLGLAGVTLNTTTGLVACLVLGIAVDDTIHLLTRFNAVAKQRASETEGIREALWTVGRPVTYTTLALCLGFLAITTSQLQNQREFGALAAFTLAVAWLVDVVFTPALAARMRVVTLWDALALDLGEDPHESIPLLAGLTRHQAKLAVLTTSLRRFPAGEKLIGAGDEGDSLFVLIHGKMHASVPGKSGMEYVEIGRGDVVGEIGFFEGRRTVDVRTSTEVTVMWLTPENLERLKKRYPRVGAQIYRNLSHVLARRMTVSTDRAR